VVFDGLPCEWLSRCGIAVRSIRSEGSQARIEILTIKGVYTRADNLGEFHEVFSFLLLRCFLTLVL
jgi:hypothetical protein